jgi:hypothetical protein
LLRATALFFCRCLGFGLQVRCLGRPAGRHKLGHGKGAQLSIGLEGLLEIEVCRTNKAGLRGGGGRVRRRVKLAIRATLPIFSPKCLGYYPVTRTWELRSSVIWITPIRPDCLRAYDRRSMPSAILTIKGTSSHPSGCLQCVAVWPQPT